MMNHSTKSYHMIASGLKLASLASIVSLLLSGTSLAAPGDVNRISEDSLGNPANRHAFTWSPTGNHFSEDGRHVAYFSTATNLHIDDNDIREDVYVYDRLSGVQELISRAGSTGSTGNRSSRHPSISADGRFVAFHSNASNLLAEDPDAFSDIYVYDRDLGVLELISRAGMGGAKGNSSSREPAISADGRYITFLSHATNLHPDDTDAILDVFVYDRDAGLVELVSRAGDSGSKGNGPSFEPSISQDGRYVAFHSQSSNLHPDDTSNGHDVFVYDRVAGTIELVSRAGASGPKANQQSANVSLSADGRYVAFRSAATNLHPDDTDTLQDIFVYDRDTGTVDLVSRSLSPGSSGNDHSFNPSINADGRYIAFRSWATNLHADDADFIQDVYVYDRVLGVMHLMSRRADGTKGNNDSGEPAISPDGSLLAFDSFATNLDGPQGFIQAFVKETGLTPSGGSVNNPPVADAGPDQTVEATANPDSLLILDGTGSYDDDGDALTYSWTNSFGTANGDMPTVYLGLGSHTITLEVDDGTETATDEIVITVQDTTAPVVTPPDDITVYATGPLTTVDIGDASVDELFPDTLESDDPGQFAPGITTVTWTATDTSGNVGTATQTVTVEYDWAGFFDPVENLPTLNTVKGGQTVPIKWSVPTPDGSYIRDTYIVSSVNMATVACEAEGTAYENPIEAETSGNSGLSYDMDAEQYIYRWKTSKSMAGTCTLFILALNDSSEHYAKFKVK